MDDESRQPLEPAIRKRPVQFTLRQLLLVMTGCCSILGMAMWSEAADIVLTSWLLYLVPMILVAGAVWFLGRRRVQWNRWDFAIVLLPFAVWATAMIADDTGKSLANLVEAFYLGCSATLAPIIRLAVGRHANQRLLAISLLAGVCLIAIGLWAFVPGLPE